MSIKLNKSIPKKINKVPGSKSYIHRFLISAFLFNSKVTIKNVNFCDDVKATIKCLKALGANFKITKSTIRLQSIKKIKTKKIVLDCNESGTTLRLLLPLASYLHQNVKFVGKESLFKRPLSIYEKILFLNKIKFIKNKNSFEIFGKFPNVNYEIDASISSQFLSGLFFISTLTKKTIKIYGNFVSKNYALITLKVLSYFGVKSIFKNKTFQLITTKTISPNVLITPPDLSALSNFLVLGALKGKLSIKINELDKLQSDYQIISILKTIGVKISFKNNNLLISSDRLKPFICDLTNCIDLGPILFILASQIDGKSKINSIIRLKIKESDRLNSMIQELNKIGTKIKLYKNSIIIQKGTCKNDHIIFNSHNDHRIIMALTILSKILNFSCEIDKIDSITKSFPTFFNIINKK